MTRLYDPHEDRDPYTAWIAAEHAAAETAARRPAEHACEVCGRPIDHPGACPRCQHDDNVALGLDTD